MKKICRMIAPAIALLTVMSVIFTMTGCSFGNDPSGKIDRVISKMSMDEKISQMIIPAIRTWNEEAVTDLQAVPELQEALRRHQYGGVILYGGNITGGEQSKDRGGILAYTLSYPCRRRGRHSAPYDIGHTDDGQHGDRSDR